MPLRAFPGCTFLDEGVIRVAVKNAAPNTKLHDSIWSKALFVTQETVVVAIGATQHHMVLVLCSSPEVHAMAQIGVGAER